MKREVSADTLRLLDNQGSLAVEMLEKEDDQHIWHVELKGSISNDCAYDVSDELFALVSTGGGLLLDMSGVEYISNTFAEMLVRLQIRMEQTDYESMPIQNLPQKIYQALKAQGCITSLDYELEEA